ncbi:MAG: hypothetical protein WD512_18675 [Candidatus Paceibacterota bacterium]
MYKSYKHKLKTGDISLLVTLLVCSILLILLTPIAQKVSVESKISRENLMSQQAVQAAKTGLDAWLYNWLEGKINEKATDGKENWPNSNGWNSLDPTSGTEYRVEFIKGSGINPSIIRSTGRVNRNGFTIERVLEDEREDL